MGLRLFFLPNFPGATFIQGGTFIPDSRVGESEDYLSYCKDASPHFCSTLMTSHNTYVAKAIR